MIKLCQIVVTPDSKPIDKMTKKLEYLYKKLVEYNTLVVEVNKSLEKHEALRRKSGIRLPKKENKE